MINTLTYANTKYTYHGSSSLRFSTINSVIRQVTHWVHTETRDTSRRLIRQVRTVGRSEMIHAKLLLLLLLLRNLMLLRDLRLLLLLLLRNLGLLLLLRGLLRSLLLLRLLLLLLRDSSSWLLVSRLLLLLEIGSLTKSVIVDISGGGISGCGGGSGGCGSGCGSGSGSSSSFGNGIGLCNRLFNNSDSNSGFLDTT